MLKMLMVYLTAFAALALGAHSIGIDKELGHTGGIGSYATVATIPGFTKVEGAMIPRLCQAKHVIKAYSTDDVSSTIKQAVSDCQDKKLSIRAARQMYHSSSDLPCPYTDTGCSYLLDMEPLNKVISLDEDARTLTAGGTYVFVDAMQYLEQRGWTLDFGYLPFYSNLTFAGMLLTGAHGSNTTGPATFGQIVKSFTWVDAKGEVHTTYDPSRYVGTLGLLGVITEMTIVIVPNYKVLAYPRRTHDHDLIERIPYYLKNPDMSLVQWRPDVRQATIMTRKRVPLHTHGEAEFSVLASKPLIAPLGAITIEVNQVDNALMANLQGPLDEIPICLAAAVLTPFFRGHYTKIPSPFGIPVVGDNKYVCCCACNEGPNFGCLWRTTVVTLYELDISWEVLQDWMRDVRSIIRKEVRPSRQGQCLPSVIEFAMRFGRASNSPLDMAYQQDTAYVDVVNVKGPHAPDAPSNYQHVFDEIEQLTLCKYKGRVHWGKNQNRAFTNPNCPTRDKYPRFQEILEEAKKYDPNGIFVSPVISQVLGRESVVKTPGCAVRNECYCTTDEDCGFHHKCVPGGTFPEYLVCKAPAEVVKDEIISSVHSLLMGR